MIEKIHLYDQALAYIREDAHSTVVHDSGLKNANGGTGVNAWEVLAREFEHYWRHVIAQEVIKAMDIDVNNHKIIIMLDTEHLLDTIWKTEIQDD